MVDGFNFYIWYFFIWEKLFFKRNIPLQKSPSYFIKKTRKSSRLKLIESYRIYSEIKGDYLKSMLNFFLGVKSPGSGSGYGSPFVHMSLPSLGTLHLGKRREITLPPLMQMDLQPRAKVTASFAVVKCTPGWYLTARRCCFSGPLARLQKTH